jgi:hypothetical protein
MESRARLRFWASGALKNNEERLHVCVPPKFHPMICMLRCAVLGEVENT